MAGADVFDLPVGMGGADNHGRELSGGGAVAEQAIGMGYQLTQGKMLARERAKGAMKMAHEHGSGHPFAGHIAQQKEERAVGFDEIAVVATDQAGGLVVITRLPTARGPVGLWKQSALNAGSESEIVFKRALLVLRKMVEAET